jgi:hypothetical protein
VEALYARRTEAVENGKRVVEREVARS